MKFLDGLVNFVSGLGTSRDKGAGARHVMSVTDWSELVAAYKSSSLVRRAVDLPAEDACREWREWQAAADQIGALEAEEQRLELQSKTIAALALARLHGGAAIIIGTGDADLSQPLEPRRIGRGGLKYLAVLSLHDISAGEIDRSPASAGFGKPEWWTMAEVPTRIHPSRLVILHGVPPMAGLSRFDTGAMHGWGDSVLPGMLATLTRVDEVAANINSLVYEAKVDVLKVPNLMRELASRGTAYSSELLRRMTLAATGKGINGTLIIDAEEEYEQKSASFGSLPEILDRAMQLASAAAGIPMTLLFGTSPAGLNATGASDIRLYYDRVRVLQALQVTPAMRVLDECLIRSALGDRPEEVHFTWRPLWQMDAKERATVGDTLMSALVKAKSIGTIPDEALGKAAVNGLTECGAFPGLEGYAEEYYREGDPDPDEDGEQPRPGDDPAAEPDQD